MDILSDKVSALRKYMICAFWLQVLNHVLIVCLLVLTQFFIWFSLANRYRVFLYEHLNTSPFDAFTSSRYWMSGLVVSGMMLVVYVAFNLLLGRIIGGFKPPPWWLVWAMSAPILVAGILLITMKTNWPTLPLMNALSSAASTLGGLALALMPGRWAARQPGDLLWLALDGAGLMPVLLLLRAVEWPRQGLGVPQFEAVLIAVGSLVITLVWLGIMTGLRSRHKKPTPDAIALFLAGLALSYLLMPLFHHLFATPPGFRYISTAFNFFAIEPVVQMGVFATGLGVSFVTVLIRHR